jgi:hypothetical protein
MQPCGSAIDGSPSSLSCSTLRRYGPGVAWSKSQRPRRGTLHPDDRRLGPPSPEHFFMGVRVKWPPRLALPSASTVRELVARPPDWIDTWQTASRPPQECFRMEGIKLWAVDSASPNSIVLSGCRRWPPVGSRTQRCSASAFHGFVEIGHCGAEGTCCGLGVV